MTSSDFDAIVKAKLYPNIPRDVNPFSTRLDIFDAIPLTAKGDLLSFNGTTNVRLPAGANGKILSADSSQPSGLKWINPTSGGTVTSIGISMPSGFSVAGSPITSSGTIAVTSSLNGPLRGNGSGLVVGNISLTSEVSGSLPITNGGTNATIANDALNNLLPSQLGNGGKVLQTDGTNATWGAAATGSVTSVGLSLPSELTVSGSPVTTSGTLTAVWANQNANLIFAGPSTGVPAIPTFRGLIAADLPLSGVGAATYGSTTQSAVITVDVFGRITSASNATIAPAASSITGGQAVTAASSKITLAGIPSSAALTTFSIDVNEANLTLDNIGGTLSITKGGTGQITANAALNALLPSQSTNAGKFLQTDGSNTSWVDDSGGTVTSFSSGDLSPLFTTSVATATTTPALSFSFSVAGADAWFGNNTGSPASPSYNSANALTKSDDTNVTLTLGGTPATSLLKAVSLTLGWTGQLSIARGGTGASTQTAAFNALSPLTTKGDLIVHNGTNNIRIAVGANNYFLVADSATSEGIKWSNDVSFSGTVAFNGEITPTALSAHTNNYNPTGISTCNFLRISATGNYDLTGVAAPLTSINQAIYIVNIGTFSITLKNSSASSTAENRFLLGADKNLQQDEGIMIIYDQTSDRWRAASVNI